MTRLLSELLQAPEPTFRHGILQLENANGGANADIRLSSEINHTAHAKLQQLGLDPHDTTSEELYAALQVRLQTDDKRLEKALRTLAATHISAEGHLMDGLMQALKSTDLPKQCFGLKASVLKTLLKKQPPKRAMKQLGYRSVDSMLKHEPAASTLAAAYLTESATWQRGLLEQYKRLKATDFETRQLVIIHPDSKRWQALAEQVVAQKRHTLINLKELSALVLLPLPADRPPAAVTTTLVLALQALNEIRASSTFLKLCQVRPDFGATLQTVVAGEPQLKTQLLDRAVPWQLVQRYYAQISERFREELFEPHIQREDLSWHGIEQFLSQLEPSLEFWHGTSHLGFVHQHKPVSLNIADVALNYCNQLPFAERIVHYFQTSLWHELMLRYLKHDTVEQTVAAQLQPQYATELVTA